MLYFANSRQLMGLKKSIKTPLKRIAGHYIYFAIL